MTVHLRAQFALYARARLEREALEAIAIKHCHARVTLPCEDLASAIALANAGEVDVLVADLTAAEETVDARDLHALAIVSQRAPVILIISDTARAKEFLPLLGRANGCLTREDGAAVLADAVACVLVGGTFTSPDAERLLSMSFAGITQLMLEKASECHQETRCLVARGTESACEKREQRTALRASCSDQPAIVVNL